MYVLHLIIYQQSVVWFHLFILFSMLLVSNAVLPVKFWRFASWNLWETGGMWWNSLINVDLYQLFLTYQKNGCWIRDDGQPCSRLLCTHQFSTVLFRHVLVLTIDYDIHLSTVFNVYTYSSVVPFQFL